MKKPMLSVILTNYNHAQYLEGALDAILTQRYEPMELVIIDDASTDNSVEIIEKYMAKHPNIRLIKNSQNRGVGENCKELLRLAQGEYIYAAASDDRVLPCFFEKTMNLLSQHPQAGLCWVDAVFINESGQKIGEDRFYLSSTPRYFSQEEVVEILRKKMFHIGGLIYKRSALIEAGGFFQELKSYADYFSVLVMAFRHGVCYISEPLVVYRVQQTQYSAMLLKDKKTHSEIIYLILNLLNSPQYADVRHRFKRSLALAYLFSPVIGVLLRTPEFRYYFTFKLALHTYWRTIKKKINPYLPLSLKNVYYYFRNIHSKRVFRSSLK
ncbi:MAG: glycosyltransferase family A protein [Deltaproteobacteria bacterium]|nr:glycosyltransferase family A protein [Deltaproteobacteria bacterium]